MIGFGTPTRSWARITAPLLAALLLHALVAAVLLRVLPGGALQGQADAPATAPLAERTIDVALGEVDPAPVAPIDGVPEPEPSKVLPAPSVPPSGGLTAPVGRTEAPAEPLASTRATDRSGNRAEESEGALEPSRPIALTVPRMTEIGIGGRNPFLPRSQAAVDEAESRRAVDRALRDPARAREQELGLGPEGPVLAALADGTARSIAPVRGRAVFIATSNADGEVVSLELADAEGGRPGWADAGRIALDGLKGKKLRVAPRTTRAVMRIEVTSAWKLPSGRDPGVNVDLFHIPISKKGEGKDSAKVSILDPIPKINVEYIELAGPGGPKIPILTVQVVLFGMTIDPADVGAHPQRVIHTHLLDSQTM